MSHPILTSAEVQALANDPAVPVFQFGSPALEQWNRDHRGHGYCQQDSGWYVVLHTTPHNPHASTFRVLSRWWYGARAPQGFDVPANDIAA